MKEYSKIIDINAFNDRIITTINNLKYYGYQIEIKHQEEEKMTIQLYYKNNYINTYHNNIDNISSFLHGIYISERARNILKENK